jgi:hypothetical protein
MNGRVPAVLLIADTCGVNAVNKDAARRLREAQIRPAIRRGRAVTSDFSGVEVATQSFVHALIADVIRREGPDSLGFLVFKGCSPAVRAVVSLVADYSQDTYGEGRDDEISD